MKIISSILLVVFAVIGVIYLVRELTYFLFKKKDNTNIVFISPINSSCKDAEYVLRSTAAKIKWVSRRTDDIVICLDCNMDCETKKICQKLCTDYGFIKLLDKNEFIDLLKSNNTDYLNL